MKKRNGPMRKTVVSLMCNNIKDQAADIDHWDDEKAIKFIHSQYLKAQRQLNQQKP